jgi:uncharacterized UPF0146 family protein
MDDFASMSNISLIAAIRANPESTPIMLDLAERLDDAMYEVSLMTAEAEAPLKAA